MTDKKGPQVVVKLGDKPNLLQFFKESPQAGKEVLETFVELAEEAVQNRWHELPQLFSNRGELSFRDLIKGILHGSLDLPDINPEAYDVIREEVHPLSMLTERKNYLEGGLRYFNWQQHYHTDKPVTQHAIAQLFRTLLRYYKYLDFDSLAKALENEQTANWRGLQNPHMVANLPFIPALRYQAAQFGELQIGKMFDAIGSFNCGMWIDGDSTTCPACSHDEIMTIGIYKYCRDCNAGWKEEQL